MSTVRSSARDDRAARGEKRRKRKERAGSRAPEPKNIVSGAGQPLDLSVRRELEEQLGHDFSQVRLHTDRDSGQLAELMGADAFAVGRDIFFREGTYRPGTADGQRLLAHELLHTVQNPHGLGALRAGRDLGAVSLPQESVEREAETAAQESVRAAMLGAVREEDPAAEVAPGQSTPGWLRYATVDADRRRAELVDPATLVDRLANGVVRSLRGDPEDLSGRVRMELSRMGPELQDSVLDRLKVRLLTSEHDRLLDLVEQSETLPMGFQPSGTPEPVPDAIDQVNEERAAEKQEAQGADQAGKQRAEDAGEEKKDAKGRAERQDQDQSRAQRDATAEQKEAGERTAQEDQRADENADARKEQQQTEEQQGQERQEADQADTAKAEQGKDGAERTKEERTAQREREEADPEQANRPGADKRKRQDDGKKPADGSKQEALDKKRKEQPGPVRPEKVDERADQRDSVLSEHGLNEQDEEDGPPREEEQPIGLEAGAEKDIDGGGDAGAAARGGTGAGEAELKPEDFLPATDLDVSSVPTAEHPDAALPSFPTPPPTKAEQVEEERENAADDEEHEDEPEAETKPPGAELGPVEGEARQPEHGPAADAGDRTEKDLQPEKPVDQEVGPDPETEQSQAPEPEAEEKKDPERAQDKDEDGARQAKQDADDKDADRDAEGGSGEDAPDAKEAQDEQQEKKDQDAQEEKRETQGQPEGAAAGKPAGVPSDGALDSGAAPSAGSASSAPPAGAYTGRTPDEDRYPSPASRRTAEPVRGEREAPAAKSVVPKESGAGAAPSGAVGGSEPAAAPSAAAGPGGAPSVAQAAVSPADGQADNPGKMGAPEGAKAQPDASLDKGGGGCAPPASAPEKEEGGGCGGGGGEQGAEEKKEEPPDVSSQDPASALNTVSSLAPDQAQAALPGLDGAADKKVGDEQRRLDANPPKRERPSGAPQTQAGPPEAEAPETAVTDAVERLGPEEQGGKQQARGSEKAQGAKPTDNIPTPHVPPAKDGKLTADDAKTVEAAADQVPTTDPELRNKTVGPAPKIKLEGESDPQRTDKQAAKLKEKQGTIRDTGRADASKSLGEDKIFPNAPKEELQGKAQGGRAGGGVGGGGTAVGGPPRAGAGAVAKQERGAQIQGATGQSRNELAAKEKEQQQGEQKSKQEKQQQIDGEVARNAEQQTAERGRVADQAKTERQNWRDEQDKKIDDADKGTEKEHKDGNDKITKERDGKDKEVEGRKDNDNKDINDKADQAEKDAKKKKEEKKKDSDSLFGKIVGAIGDFFKGLLDAVTKIFDEARKAINNVIDAFKEFADKAIDAVRDFAVKAINAVADALIAIGDVLLAAFPELRDKFRKAINDLRDKAIDTVNKLAEGLKKAVNDLLDTLAAGLNALLDVLEAGLKAALKIFRDAIVGALKFAEAAIEALGKFAALVADIAPDPGGWLKKAGSAAKTGIQEHLWGAIKTAVKQWFDTKVEGILGLGKAVINVLIKGCLSLKQIGKMAWEAIVASLPMMIAALVIEKVVSMIIPAAGAIITIVQGLMAAWQSVSAILAAFGKFFAFLKAVKAGPAACLFAEAVAAGVVALLELITNLLLARLGRAAKGVGNRLKGIAQKIMKGLKKTGKGARKAAGNAVNRARGAVRKAAQALRKPNGPTKPKGPKVPSRPGVSTEHSPNHPHAKGPATSHDRPNSRTPNKERDRRREEDTARREREAEDPTRHPAKDKPDEKSPSKKHEKQPEHKQETPKKKKETEAPKRTKPRKPKSPLGRALKKIKSQVKSALKKVRNAGKALGKKLRNSKLGKALKNSAKKARDFFKKKRDHMRDHKKTKNDHKKQNREDQKKKEKSPESKESRLEKIVARIQPKLDGLLQRGVPRRILQALLSAMRTWYRLTGLETVGSTVFDIIAALNPSKKSNSGKWKEEYGGEGRRKQIDPKSNIQGERYGEQQLAPVTYERLPAEVQSALKDYTHSSWPYNLIARGTPAEEMLQGVAHPLRGLFGGRDPKLFEIYNVSRSTLTYDQLEVIDAIHNDPYPQKKLMEVLKGGYQTDGYRRLAGRFGGKFPTAEDIRDRMRLIDRGASSHRLPHGVTVHRSLQDISFLPGFRGTPQSLRGTTQVEKGYMSGSLGEGPAYPDTAGMTDSEVRQTYRYRLHLDVPAGSRAVWMGVKSDYPDQRELIQPRNTKYRIVRVKGPDRPGPDGVWDIYAKVILQ
ncbi:eCIS core domain-containing protein [Streptomyces celluloflavus]|uniref:eCIS core domain-containing protein n=1 Tax=Streptomyces celluloflavus TaxID=58344 RepID=UPI00364E5340